VRYVYDTSVLIAIDREPDGPAAWEHRQRMALEDRVLVPAVVAAQALRDPARQANLMRAIRGCDVVPFDRQHWIPVGRLLAATRTSDVVDGFVAILAAAAADVIVTSDSGDIRPLLNALGADVAVVPA
jgi:predicted nucleic acid-binding protein